MFWEVPKQILLICGLSLCWVCSFFNHQFDSSYGEMNAFDCVQSVEKKISFQVLGFMSVVLSLILNPLSWLCVIFYLALRYLLTQVGP